MITAVIARFNSFAPPVALVLVGNSTLADVQFSRRVLERIQEAPELKGFAIVLGARDSDLTAPEFYGDPQVCTTLSKLNWMEFSFQSERLSIEDWT